MNSQVSPRNPLSPSNQFKFLPVNPWFYTLFSIFVLLVIFGFKLINDFDLGFHLKGGQWILENHKVPLKDTYTYTVSGHDYLDIQWLYQVFLYLQYRIGGYSFLPMVSTGLIVLVFIITFARIRWSGAPFGFCVLLLLAVLLACELRFRVRPEILSWLLMSLVFYVLELRWNGKRDMLFLLPLIQLVWVNVEGLFGIGLILMVFFLVSGYLHQPKIDKKLFLFTGLSAVACLLNPYFIHGLMFPLTLLTTLGDTGTIKSGISEFQSPWTMAQHSAFVPEWTFWTYKLFSFFLLFLLLVTYNKRKVHEYLLVISFFYLSATAQRNISLFMIVCSPVAASCWKDLNWDWLRKLQDNYFYKPLSAWIFTFLVLALSLRVVTSAYYVSERRLERFGFGLDISQMPVRATEFLAQNHLDGKILNHLNFGGWLDWKGPQKIFIDGRLEVMGEEVFSEYRDSQESGKLGPLLNKYGVDILFFNPDHAFQWLAYLRTSPTWRPVYLDETGVVFLRKGYADQIPMLDDIKTFQERNIPSKSHEDALTIIQAPKPSTFACFLTDFIEPTKYSQGLTTLADFYFYAGRFDFAEQYFLENIRRTQGRYYELVFNLGNMYFNTQKYYEARICMQRVLSEEPDLAPARQIMAILH